MGNVPSPPVQCLYAPTHGAYQLEPFRNPADAPSQRDPTNFNVMAAGVTELSTAHGVVVSVSLKVKALYLIGYEAGLPVYELDFELMPKARKLFDDLNTTGQAN